MKFLILTVAFMLVQLSQQAALGEMYEDGDVQSQERTEFTVDDSGNPNPSPGGGPSGRNLEEGQEPQEDPSERNQEVQEEVEPQEDPSQRRVKNLKRTHLRGIRRCRRRLNLKRTHLRGISTERVIKIIIIITEPQRLE